MSISALAREEIRNLRPYRCAGAAERPVRLNANESPLETGTQSKEGLNRYPARRPAELAGLMARHYGTATGNLLVTRGSSEGIDLLIRTFCTPGEDQVLITPPVFDMYRVYASIQGAGVVSVPLQAGEEFTLDTAAVLDACNAQTKLIFLCSPNNPLGSVIPRDEILRIAAARAGKSVIVVDEAYIEFSDTDSLAPLVADHDNLVVLRTLSKAYALAGARCGALIGPAGLIQLLDGVLAPYALAAPVVASAALALGRERLRLSEQAIRQTVAERERMRRELADCRAVERTWPSEANFLFVRFRGLDDVERRLERGGIAIRTYGDDSPMPDCARITISTEADNDCLLEAIRSLD